MWSRKLYAVSKCNVLLSCAAEINIIDCRQHDTAMVGGWKTRGNNIVTIHHRRADQMGALEMVKTSKYYEDNELSWGWWRKCEAKDAEDNGWQWYSGWQQCHLQMKIITRHSSKLSRLCQSVNGLFMTRVTFDIICMIRCVTMIFIWPVTWSNVSRWHLYGQ